MCSVGSVCPGGPIFPSGVISKYSSTGKTVYVCPVHSGSVAISLSSNVSGLLYVCFTSGVYGFIVSNCCSNVGISERPICCCLNSSSVFESLS